MHETKYHILANIASKLSDCNIALTDVTIKIGIWYIVQLYFWLRWLFYVCYRSDLCQVTLLSGNLHKRRK